MNLKKRPSLFLLVLFANLFFATVPALGQVPAKASSVLYRAVFNSRDKYPELLLNGNNARFTDTGLVIPGKGKSIQLDKFYSLGERLVRYHLRFSPDTKMIFESNTGDFRLVIDVAAQTATVETKPVNRKKISIDPAHDQLVEISRDYLVTGIRISDLVTGETDQMNIQGDGSGGVGEGAVGPHTNIIHQWDKYCFGLMDGGPVTVRQVCVQAPASNLTLLLYGDSQTQPEGYFPKKDFPLSWTQLVMQHVNGKAISSGRGSGNIVDVLERIKNELPFLKATYVMVTIGANGGNTEANLSELVEYIRSQGSIPILNNIACNEHGTQVEINRLIDKVRRKYKLNGCRFDIATSLNRDGKEVDKTMMWHEDYSAVNDWGHFWHHPNVKGSRLMYLQTLIDVPEIYD
jgi:lysophospholipase L1-like esterase